MAEWAERARANEGAIAIANRLMANKFSWPEINGNSIDHKAVGIREIFSWQRKEDPAQEIPNDALPKIEKKSLLHIALGPLYKIMAQEMMPGHYLKIQKLERDNYGTLACSLEDFINIFMVKSWDKLKTPYEKVKNGDGCYDDYHALRKFAANFKEYIRAGIVEQNFSDLEILHLRQINEDFRLGLGGSYKLSVASLELGALIPALETLLGERCFNEKAFDRTRKMFGYLKGDIVGFVYRGVELKASLEAYQGGEGRDALLAVDGKKKVNLHANIIGKEIKYVRGEEYKKETELPINLLDEVLSVIETISRELGKIIKSQSIGNNR